MNKPPTFIFIGKSGCGKGTQVELLKNYLKEKYPETQCKIIAMGDVFRDFFKKDTFVSNIAREISMTEGKFQPDFLTDSLFVSSAIDIIDLESFLFIDGYPRGANELDTVKSLFEYVQRENITIINILVSHDSVKKRMLARGRGDDQDRTIENRLQEYENDVVPMIEKVKQDSFFKYLEINGEPTPEEIFKDLVSKLGI